MNIDNILKLIMWFKIKNVVEFEQNNFSTLASNYPAHDN